MRKFTYGNSLFLPIAWAICAMLFWACEGGGPTASSSFGPEGLPSVSEAPAPSGPSVTPVNPGATVPDGVASASDIEIVGLNRAGIRVTARCSGVTFFVPATGADYVNVWIPEIFGLKYGPNPVNEEFVLNFAPGTYQYQLAVEAKTGDPAHPIAQDDRHRGSFTVVCDTPPPPPPRCDLANLERRAAAECQYGYKLNAEACTFECNSPTCENFEKPEVDASITGAPDVSVGASSVTVGQGSIVADTFSVSFPLVTARPEYSQPAGSWSFTAQRSVTENYGPEGLDCSVSDSDEKEFSGVVDPKEPTCEQVNEPSYEVVGPTSDKRYYYELDEIPGTDNDTNRQAFCQTNGGTWLNDSNDNNGYDPSFDNVCRTSAPNATIDGQADDESFQMLTTATVNFFNEGGAAQLKVGSTIKDQDSVNVACGQSGSVQLSYGWNDFHENSTFIVTVQQ